MSTEPTTTLDLASVAVSLVPVIVGGFIALAGAIGGGILNHWLRARSERSSHLAAKYEELLRAIFEHKHWLGQMSSHRVFDGENPQVDSPIARVRALCSLYFPQFKEKVKAMDLAADQYEVWMFRAGHERLTQGVLTDVRLEEGKSLYAPYTKALHELVRELENYAEYLYR